MIHVVATNECVEISGHAGIAEKGHDIVCAAVSALGNACACMVWDAPEVRDGYLLIRWRNADQAEVHYVDFLMAGLRLIADEYPNAVSIDDYRDGEMQG